MTKWEVAVAERDAELQNLQVRTQSWGQGGPRCETGM